MQRIPLEAYLVSYDELLWTIGTLIGVLFTGGLITAGISCIFFLSKASHGPKQQAQWLRAYIIILILLVLAFEVVLIVESHESTIFYFYSTEKPVQLFLHLRTLHFFLAVVIASLMDGLLTWRCFMVQKVLGNNESKWENLFWVFPTCLWCSFIVTGLCATFLKSSIMGLPAAPYLLHAVMNSYAASFLTLKLLSHRKMLRACLGESACTSHHIHLVNILLESAAINVPVVISAAAGYIVNKKYEHIMIAPVIASQAFASVLVIQQVALGRAFSRNQEVGGELSRGESQNNYLTETRTSSLC